ncbi:MAG: PfkB family carbohydrate kinase [Candidatus Bathyarchaeota archaeon]|nr:PfkB family carbohydrate kinase [Candidatus Bathyarchaeota archaeon]
MKGFTVAGHVAVDEVITANGSFYQLGGPPCFAASLGNSLGFNVEIVTRIGEDFPDEYETELEQLGISTMRSNGYQNTRFVLDYRHEPRKMKLPSICKPIKTSDVADVERLLLCPIAGEINDQLLKEVETSFLGLDPQGLLRNVGFDYIVEPRKWWNPEALNKLDLLKTSSSEHHLITGTTDIKQSLRKLVDHGVGAAVITDGSNGSYVMTGSMFIHVPVFPVEVVDSTGAGDVFIAGLAAYLDEGLSWACAVASASSSAIVETHGIVIQRSKSEILERAEWVYEKIVSLD